MLIKIQPDAAVSRYLFSAGTLHSDWNFNFMLFILFVYVALIGKLVIMHIYETDTELCLHFTITFLWCLYYLFNIWL